MFDPEHTVEPNEATTAFLTANWKQYVDHSPNAFEDRIERIEMTMAQILANTLKLPIKMHQVFEIDLMVGMLNLRVHHEADPYALELPAPSVPDRTFIPGGGTPKDLLDSISRWQESTTPTPRVDTIGLVIAYVVKRPILESQVYAIVEGLEQAGIYIVDSTCRTYLTYLDPHL